MTLPTGQISLSQVNTEIGYPSTQLISLNDTNVRILAQKPSGQISMSDLRGKAWLTQEMVLDWVQDNRNTAFNWVFGGSGDSRYVNNPYQRYVSTSTVTFNYSLSGAALPDSNWTTIILTVSATTPNITAYNVNGGGLAINTATMTYNYGQMQQVRLLLNTNFKNVTSVYLQWTRSDSNRGSYASSLIVPGKWESYSAADPGTSISIPANSFHVGSMFNSSSDGAVTLIGGAPPGGARMWFNGYWYSNASLFLTTNASSSAVTQTFSGQAHGDAQYASLFSSMAAA